MAVLTLAAMTAHFLRSDIEDIFGLTPKYSLAILILLSAIFLVAKLQGDTNMSWYAVFGPFWGAMSLLLIVDRNWPQFRVPTERDSYKYYDYSSSWEFVGQVLDVLPTNTFFSVIAFTVLLATKLQRDLAVSWLLVYAPLWYIVSVTVLLHLSTITVKKSLNIWDTLGIPSVVTIPFIAFLIMLYFYTNNTIKLSVFVLFIPLFWIEVIVFALPFLLFFITPVTFH
jgi:hypothetical protein